MNTLAELDYAQPPTVWEFRERYGRFRKAAIAYLRSRMDGKEEARFEDLLLMHPAMSSVVAAVAAMEIYDQQER